MSILRISLPQPHGHLSFSKTLISPSDHRLFIPAKTPILPLTLRPAPIRMGGGPRTYPGGVSKWQWKRMQAKKAKQLLKARLTRERQIYEMRKRAELKAAVSELERPWEAVERAPTLSSVSADEQLKVLADRFQKPGGFDMWSENDGPELFKTVDGLPSARFFPKGVVHSIKPYGKVAELEGSVDSSGSGSGSDSELDEELDGYEKNRTISSHRIRGREMAAGFEADDAGGELSVRYWGYPRNSDRRKSPKPNQRPMGRSQLDDFRDKSAAGSENRVRTGANRSSTGRMRGKDVDSSESSGLNLKNGRKSNGRMQNVGKAGNGRMANNESLRKFGALNTGGTREGRPVRVGFDRKQRGESFGGGFRTGRINRMNGSGEHDAEVYDMNLQDDGTYGL